jgi:FemAB-related protein (PEP-CTERM system-associated)
MSISVEQIDENNMSELKDYILEKNKTTFVDLWDWRRLVEKIYGYSHYWYLAKDSGKVSGFLGLTFVEHPIFGKYLSTAAFANHGGFYADNLESADALVCQATAIQEEVGAKYVLLRHLEGEEPPPEGWHQDDSYATYMLALTDDPNTFYRDKLRSKKRNKIKKSNSFDFKVSFGGIELLDDLWCVISLSMKELGSPYHSKEYLRTILQSTDLAPEVVVVYTNDNLPAAASLLVHHQETVTQIHSNSLTRYRHMCVGDHLYWSIISNSCQRQYKYLDMGRSLIGSGNEVYKMEWRPEKINLAYWYHLAPGQDIPQLKQNNRKFQTAIRIWQQLPLFLVRLIGPKIISGIV